MKMRWGQSDGDVIRKEVRCLYGPRALPAGALMCFYGFMIAKKLARSSIRDDRDRERGIGILV
jgi:hypothetical protein